MRVLYQLGLNLCLFASLSSAYEIRYGSQDRFWRHHAEQKSLIIDGIDYYTTIDSCLDEKLTKQERQDVKTHIAENRKVGKMYEDTHHDVYMMVIVEQALAPIHAKAVTALATCVQEILPDFYECRPLAKELGSKKDLGGNCPIHLEALLSIFLPEVTVEMKRTLQLAYDEAEWDIAALPEGEWEEEPDVFVLPPPRDVGLRCTEILTYTDQFKNMKDHSDGRSNKYTLNYALKGKDEYEGGEFYIRHENGEETTYVKPDKYDAIIFLGGNYYHGITEITSGKREMFCSEYWAYPDAPLGSTLWHNGSKRMTKYVDLCDKEAKKRKGPCKVDYFAIDEGSGELGQDEEENEKEEEADDEEQRNMVLKVARSVLDGGDVTSDELELAMKHLLYLDNLSMDDGDEF